MSEFENTVSENTEEVAELPNEETGVEDAEVADQQSEEAGESIKTDENAAWARMRREAETARAEAEELKAKLEAIEAENNARNSTISKLTGADDGEISALAEITGLTEDEIRAEMEYAKETAEKDLRISQLEDQLMSIEADKAMRQDLAEIQKIDPKINALEELGDEFRRYVEIGLSASDAYWAVKAKDLANQAKPPTVVAGQVQTGSSEKDYFTDAEIDAMSSEQLSKNWKKIMASWEKRK